MVVEIKLRKGRLKAAICSVGTETQFVDALSQWERGNSPKFGGQDAV
jgi:hypothetical protein